MRYRLPRLFAAILAAIMGLLVVAVPSAQAGAPPAPAHTSNCAPGHFTAEFPVDPSTGQVPEIYEDSGLRVTAVYTDRRTGRPVADPGNRRRLVNATVTVDGYDQSLVASITVTKGSKSSHPGKPGKTWSFTSHPDDPLTRTVPLFSWQVIQAVQVCLLVPQPACTTQEVSGEFTMVNGDLAYNTVYDALRQPVAQPAFSPLGVPAGDVLHLNGPVDPAITVIPGTISVVTRTYSGEYFNWYPEGFPFAVTEVLKYAEIAATYRADATVCAVG